MRKRTPIHPALAALLAALAAAPAARGATQAVTEHGLDASGNTVRISTESNTGAPRVDALDPGWVRRGAASRITATGANLKNAKVTAQGAGLDVAPVSSTAGSVTFDLTAAATSAAGVHPLNFSTALGGTSADVEVLDAGTAPILAVAPNPLALVAGQATPLVVSLDKADGVDNTLYFSVADPQRAKVEPAQALLRKGQVVPDVAVSVTGLAEGATELVVKSSFLSGVTVPVTVAKGYQLAAGDYTFYTPGVGSYRAPSKADSTHAAPAAAYRAPSEADSAYAAPTSAYRAPSEADSAYAAPTSAYRAPSEADSAYAAPTSAYRAPYLEDSAYAQAGALRAAVVDRVSPAQLAVGANNPVTLYGLNLGRVTAVALDPADGVVVDPLLEAAPDGTSLTVHILVLDGTAPSARRLKLTATGGAALFSAPDGDLLEIR